MSKFRIIAISLTLLCCLLTNAQFSDNFSDGNFTENPQWIGTTDKFVIENNALKLNDLDASGAGSFKSYLLTSSSSSINAEWSCNITANTSLTSSNYIRFYIISDKNNLNDPSLRGYFILIGGTQKEVALYRQNGPTLTKIIDGTNSRLATTTNIVQVKATRDEQWNWHLYSKLQGETDFVLEGEAVDNQNKESAFSGILVAYTSSNRDKYFFDDFSVTGSPYLGTTQNIERHAVVISEIMADPDPVVSSLPNAEYIELYNRSNKKIILDDWKILCGNTQASILSGQIEPNGFLILCSAQYMADFQRFGAVAKINNMPLLPNSAGLIVLKDADDNTITWTEYSGSWFGDDNFKKDGGFSLERVDIDNLNNTATNWQPSQNPVGGTPFEANSTQRSNPDDMQPKLLAVSVLSNTSCQLIFNKEMNKATLNNIQNYISDSFTIEKATPIEPKLDRVELTFSQSSEDTTIIYVENLKCVSGFSLNKTHFRLAKSQDMSYNDLIINEILYNPNETTSEFIELFNKSDKVVNIAKLFITKRGKNGLLEAKKTITTDSILIFPNQYVLLTDNLNSVCNNYICGEDGIKISTSFSALPNTEGNIVLSLSNATIIDEFSYDNKMQSPTLINTKGVSLERINPYAATNDKNNWFSASFSENYATPARQNSQFNISKTELWRNYWLDYETFTPDNDGYRDYLTLNYRLPEEGYNITATIYTPNGLKIKTLCNNLIAGISGVIRWNGSADNDSMCDVGIYVIKIQASNAKKVINGTVVCVLSMK